MFTFERLQNPWVNDDLILEASSVRFSPDGTQLAIAQDCQPVFRIALFTTGGDFIRNFGMCHSLAHTRTYNDTHIRTNITPTDPSVRTQTHMPAHTPCSLSIVMLAHFFAQAGALLTHRWMSRTVSTVTSSSPRGGTAKS